MRLAPAALVALALGLAAPEAAAQKVVACRDRNMQIVACASGGDGGGGGGGTMPGAGAMGAAAYGMGYAIGTFLRSLMVDDTDYEALARQEAEQQRLREENLARQRAAHQDDQERWRRHELNRQQQFQSEQRDLLGQIRGLNTGTAVTTLGPKVETPTQSGGLGVRQLDTSAPPQGALPQLQALDQNKPAMLGGTPEQAHQAASRGFDTPQAAGPSPGPLMQVKGVPAPPPSPTATGPDPLLQPMSLEQRRLVAEGRKAQSQLDVLRQRRVRGEIDADTLEREEAALKQQIARLAQQFAAAPAPDAAASSAPPPARLASVAPPRGLTMIGSAAGDAVGSCFPADPATTGCIEIRNAGSQRVRVYFQELPGVFCTIEPGSMCSRPATQGVYNGFAERDDGRRTAIATLLHTPAGVRWGIQFP